MSRRSRLEQEFANHDMSALTILGILVLHDAEDDAGDAKAMINQFKELAGIGDLDDSAQWCVHRARASVFSFLGKILTLRSILSGYH